MELREYQQRSARTDQRIDDPAGVIVHLLGLAGEAGSVTSEYKKYLRDGSAHHWWKSRMREELGDVLWYVANVATHVGLDLDEIAGANLEKTSSRWLPQPPTELDAAFPNHERLARSGVYEFRPGKNGADRDCVTIWFEGEQIGDELTDASHVEDGYRFHDVFHLAYATLLGWSPVTRHLARRKRRSNHVVDENEDGGRAIVIEEGVAALAFAYGTQHELGANIERLDQKLLDTIEMLVAPFEVGVRTHAEWEAAILAGMAAFRALKENNGGLVRFDSNRSLFEYAAFDERGAGSTA